MADGYLHRYVVFSYGLFAYLLALGIIVYAVGFLANVFVPKSIDAGATYSREESLIADLVLIGLFGLQHSLMARPRFKAMWTQLVPEPVERSTYVLFANLALIVLMWGWRPLPEVIWQIDGVTEPVLWGVYLGGWLLMLAAVNMINMNDLLGQRQVRASLQGCDLESIDFRTPGLYRYIRHPIMTGFLVAFWVTPQMSVGHLIFAGGMTIYILIGVILEERDLTAVLGDRYHQYQTEVPMFVPRPWRSVSSSPDDSRLD